MGAQEILKNRRTAGQTGSTRSALKRAIVLLFITSQALTMNAQIRWSAELHGGAAANVNLPLIILQPNYPDIRIHANYDTHPFESPVYYGYRLSRWSGNTSWELDFVHHKLYLKNAHPEIDYFNISHGFNILTINRGFQFPEFILRPGAGIIIAHPEFRFVRDGSKIESDSNSGLFRSGYIPGGIVLSLGAARQINISRRFFITAEAKNTFAYIPLSRGDLTAHVYNWAFHFTLGPGFNFILKE